MSLAKRQLKMWWIGLRKPSPLSVLSKSYKTSPVLKPKASTSTDSNGDPATQTRPETGTAVSKSDTMCLHEKSWDGFFCHRGGKEGDTSSKDPQRGTICLPGYPPLPMPCWRSTLAALPPSHTREGMSWSPRSSLACSINPRSYL